MRVFLLGYMGAGKSTLGRQLAKELNCDFYDLDRYIEDENQCTLTIFFQKYGEDTFRKEERRRLLELCRKSDIVISVGGGTPCYYDNMELMNKCGKTIFLNPPLSALICRLETRKKQRPLLADKTSEELKTFVTESYTKRLPFYDKAQHKIQAQDIKVEHLLPFFS